MTGIVVVSHSRPLAEAAVALAGEMVGPGTVLVEVAAGLDPETFGTDATAIMSALAAADDGSGVVVLMDLGSAVLSAELALELVDPDLRARTVLCPAPLVEGLVVAVVAAASGATPREVADEAADALLAKQSQLVPTSLDDPAPAQRSSAGATASAVFVVSNEHGLHARPAAKLVTAVARLDADVTVKNLTTSSDPVSARSLSRVATLGALRGHQVEVAAAGREAQAAVDAVMALAGDNFGERNGDALPVAAPLSRGPVAASPGIAIGPVVHRESTAVAVPDELAADTETEWRRIAVAISAARDEISRIRAAAATSTGAAGAAIFDAHLLLLDDPDLLAEVRGRVDAGDSAPRAWADATTALAAQFEALADPYLQARAADVRAVGEQVARALVGGVWEDFTADGVLVADDLTPAEMAGLDPARTVGIVLAGGSPTGHSAILAKARGIPAVVAGGPGVLSVPAGTLVAVDGSTGELVVDPDPATVARLRARLVAETGQRETATAQASGPAETVDLVRVLVGANIGSVDDALAATACGADLAGLVRTEFLFLGRDAAPDVDEQVDVYRRIAQALGGRRITLRTLDVGGDKPLPYAPQPVEANPFLGVRGIRLALTEQRLLYDQLEAIVRVAHETPVSVMFPMVSTLDELFEARRRLDQAISLVGRGRPPELQVGIMVEVPAVALKASAFVPYVDFFSIGTNDLTQYALAAERGNPALAALADPLDPGVLGLVEAVCHAARGGPLVAVCGELAGDPSAVSLLVGLGVRELSMAPRSIPAAKAAVRSIVTAEDDDLVKRALAAPSAAEVRSLLGDRVA